MKRTSIFLFGIVLFSCHVFAQLSEPVPPGGYREHLYPRLT